MSMISNDIAQGFHMGLGLIQAQQARENALARLQMAQDAARQRIAAQQAEQQYRTDSLNMRGRELDFQQGKYLDQQDQIASAQRANLSRFDSLDQQPDPMGNYTGPFDDEHPAPPMVPGALGIDRAAFAGASPSAQNAMLAPSLQQQRDLARQTASANIKRQTEELIRQRKHSAIAASNLPEAVKERLHMRADDVQGIPSQILSPEEWAAMPYRQTMGTSDPETSALSDAYVAATGKFPEHIILQHLSNLQRAASRPDNSDIAAANAERRDYLDATSEWRIARGTLAAFDKANPEGLYPPTDKPATDPAWTAYNKAQQQRRPLQQALDIATREREQARKRSQQSTQQMRTRGTTARPPMQAAQNPAPADLDAAAQQAIRELPNADEATQHKRMLEILGQQQGGGPAGTSASNPYDDYRSSLDDGMDDEPDDDQDDLED